MITHKSLEENSNKMLREYFGTSMIIAFTMFLLIAAIQTGIAIYFYKSEAKPEPAALFVVFPGGNQRIGTGIQLIKDGLSNNFMVVGQTSSNLSKLLIRNNGPNTVTTLPGGKSRSTFEDAHQTVKVAKAYNVQSITVVTSSYHLPRAMGLLKLHLIISGNNAKVHGYPATKEHNPKHYSNEIVKFWGSLIEMSAYFATGKLVLDSPKAKKVQLTLKNNFTWKI